MDGCCAGVASESYMYLYVCTKCLRSYLEVREVKNAECWKCQCPMLSVEKERESSHEEKERS